MSIVSNISTAFFSDCNTFATPTDPSYTKVVSFNKKIEQIYHPILPSSLLYRIAIKGSMELVYYICFQSSPLGSFMVSGVRALRFRRDSKQRRVTTKALDKSDSISLMIAVPSGL